MEQLRRKSNKIVLGFVFVVIVVSFVFWGVGNVEVSAPGSLTSVNGEEIPFEDFQWQYRIQSDFQERLRGGRAQLTEDDIKRMEASVAQSLVMQTLLTQQSKQLGFQINDAEILDKLKETKVFNDPEKNRFSPGIYARVLEANGITQSQYERTLRRDLMGSRLRDLLEMSILVSDAEMADIQKTDQTRFNLEIASWDQRSLVQSGLVKTTEAALKDFYEKHKGEFLSAPQRSGLLASLSPVQVERSIAVPQAEIDSYYNSNVKDSKEPTWTTAQAHAYHILISDNSPQGLKKIKEAEAKIKGAKDTFDAFRKTAAEISEDFSNAALGGDLGYFGEKMMVKPFAQAVFSGKLNSVLGPVKTDFGYHLILVTDRTTGSNSLADRQKQITYEIRRTKLEAKIREIDGSAQNVIKGSGETAKAELEKLGFTLSEFSNLEPNQRTVGVPFLFNQKIFEAPTGKWSEPSLIQGSLYLSWVRSETAPQPLGFDAAKDRVRAKWESQETETWLRKQFESLKAGKTAWKDLPKLGAIIKIEKDFKPFTAFEVPGFGGSESALRSAQGLSAQHPISEPLFHDGKWAVMRGTDFRSEPLKALSAEEKIKQKQILRDERKALVLDSYLQSLLKNSKIPGDFKAKYPMQF